MCSLLAKYLAWRYNKTQYKLTVLVHRERMITRQKFFCGKNYTIIRLQNAYKVSQYGVNNNEQTKHEKKYL